MACRRSGDKPLYEPMMAKFNVVYMRHSASWVIRFTGWSASHCGEEMYESYCTAYYCHQGSAIIGLQTHPCVSDMDLYWFRWYSVSPVVPSHYLNKCRLLSWWPNSSTVSIRDRLFKGQWLICYWSSLMLTQWTHDVIITSLFIITSKRRCDVFLTLLWRYHYVACPLRTLYLIFGKTPVTSQVGLWRQVSKYYLTLGYGKKKNNTWNLTWFLSAAQPSMW